MDRLDPRIKIKLAQAEAEILHAGSLVVAFSGGVDSSVVALLAFRCLRERAVATFGRSPAFTDEDLNVAQQVARFIGIPLMIIETEEFKLEGYLRNLPSRCFYCKAELFGKLERVRNQLGFAFIAYGANADDAKDFRPGAKAADKLNILAPLARANLHKDEIRDIARFYRLPNWSRPSNSCLSSRIPYGTRISVDALERVRMAEEKLRSLGFAQVRVRDFGRAAVVELDKPFDELTSEDKADIEQAVIGAGYSRVRIDPEGYQQGKLYRIFRQQSNLSL